MIASVLFLQYLIPFTVVYVFSFQRSNILLILWEDQSSWKVNLEYALKYMTTFLLKYVRKDELMQKRRDIFVDSLVILGYIRQNEAGKYELQASFDKERLTLQLD